MIGTHPFLKIITASNVFDGERVLSGGGGVVIAGDEIVAVGNPAALERHVGASPVERLDFSECTLLPGLIDSHAHLVMPGGGESIMDWASESNEMLLLVAAANAEKALRAGVTTLVDLGGKDDITFRLRDAIRRGLVPGPRLLLCGRALTITGGHGWPWHGEADGVEGVQKAVRQLCKEGADLIKVMVTGGGTPGTDGKTLAYSSVELGTLVREAHRRGRSVFAHCTATKGIRQAYEAGVDVIVHCQFIGSDGGSETDSELCASLAAHGIAVNPTLAINKVLESRAVTEGLSSNERDKLDSWIGRYWQFERDTLELHRSGIRLVCGSDCGWGWLQFGETHIELEALVSAGLTELEALRTATAHAADAAGVGGSTGRLRIGQKADLLIVEGNAAISLAALRNVAGVWLGGQRVEGKLGPAIT